MCGVGLLSVRVRECRSGGAVAVTERNAAPRGSVRLDGYYVADLFTPGDSVAVGPSASTQHRRKA